MWYEAGAAALTGICVATTQVQQDLARPGVLERFVPDAEDAKLLRSCFAGVLQLLTQAKECKRHWQHARNHWQT